MASNHDDLGFIEDDAPQAAPQPMQQPQAQAAPQSGHDDLGFEPDPSPALQKLMSQGYLFDDYYKLDPQEKAFYDDHMKKEGAKSNAGLGLGLSKGAFMPAEIINKVIPGESVPNFREQAISGVERGIANLIGDQPTKDLYAGMSHDELTQRNVAKDQQVQQDAPGAVMVGELAAGLPANIAVGGGAGAAAKAAQFGKAATAATNIGTAGLVGEGYGIANSNAPTLAERATEGLPSAAIAMGTAGLFEGGAALASPQGQALARNASNALRGKAAVHAEQSLNPTATQYAKMTAPGKQGIVGEKLLDEGLGNNPFMSDEAKAKVLNQARDKAGLTIESSTKQLDNEVQNLLNANENQISQGTAFKQLEELKNRPQATTEVTEKLIPDSKSVTAEALPEDTQLGFPRNETELTERSAQSKFMPVERTTGPQPQVQEIPGITRNGQPVQRSLVEPDVQKEVERLNVILKRDPSKADRLEPILNKDNFIRELETKVNAPYEVSDANHVKDLYRQYLADLSQTGGDGTSIITINGLNKFKQQLRTGINYQTEGGVIAKAKKDFTKDLNEMILSKAQQIDETVGTDLSSALIKSNQEYGALKTGASTANMNLARQATQEDPTAALMGGAGFLAKGAKGGMTGVALSGAKKAISNNYNSFAATSLNQLSKLVNSTPQAFGKFAPALQDAAKRGSTALTATHFALYQNDPEYRAIIDPIKDSAEKEAKDRQQEEPANPEFNDLNK